MEVLIEGLTEEEAENRVQEMCEKLLANTVIESYRYTLSSQE